MGYLGEDIGKLGFGLMRLPKKGLGFDQGQIEEMVDAFLSAGFTYFDTARIYPGSEKVTRKALVERHPRDSFQLATKLFASMAPTEKAAKGQLETSLERCGTDYFDYYLLHFLNSMNYKRYEKWKLWDYVLEQKERGIIRHVGFSFHDGPELLDQILTEHPETEFVQLQINYADWNHPKIQSRANYEVARKHGKPIIIMEPIKGGKLANPPAEVRKILHDANPDASFASWAMRFAASLEGIITVLSGMSTLGQMEDNLSYMRDFQPLDAEERAALLKAQEILGKSELIPCTACGYCLPGCPENIPIPDVIAAMNTRISTGRLDEAAQAYAKAVEGKGSAADCIGCGKCNNTCPQMISVMETIRESAKAFA